MAISKEQVMKAVAQKVGPDITVEAKLEKGVWKVTLTKEGKTSVLELKRGFMEDYFDRGEYVKAREILEKRHEVLKKGGYKGGIKEIFGFEYLFRTYIELGEIERAMKLIDNMDEFALQVRDKEYISIADALRGMQFRAEKKWKDRSITSRRALRNPRT